MDYENLRESLNDLIQRTEDAEKGFKMMYTKANRAGLMDWMNKYKDERSAFQSVLEKELQNYGGRPDEDTTFLGKIHRAWADMKISATDDNYSAILDECIRGEEQLLKDYTKVIEDVDMPGTTRSILTAQREIIQESLNTLEALNEDNLVS